MQEERRILWAILANKRNHLTPWLLLCSVHGNAMHCHGVSYSDGLPSGTFSPKRNEWLLIKCTDPNTQALTPQSHLQRHCGSKQRYGVASLKFFMEKKVGI